MPPRGFPQSDNRLRRQQQQPFHQQQQQPAPAYEDSAFSLPAQHVPLHHPTSSASLRQQQQHPTSARPFLQSNSSSSLSHALDMQYPRKQKDESHLSNRSSNSSSESVWLHSTQQPVTDEELNALLASKPWNPSQVDTDESFEDILSLPFSTSAFPPTSTDSATPNNDILWTDSHLPAEDFTGPGHSRMLFEMNETTNSLQSDPSLSPSSYTNSPFHRTSLDSRYLDTLPIAQNVDPYTHSSDLYSQAMPFTMTTPINYTHALLDHDPLSSPEDNLLQSLQHRHYSTLSNASPTSLQDQSLQHSNTHQQSLIQRQYPGSSISSTPSFRSNARGMESNTNIRLGSTIGGNRPRAGTFAPSSSYSVEMRPRLSSSASSTGTMEKIQESSAMNFTNGISTSLSAELAGLGLNVSDFPMATSFSKGDESTEMQRRDSSSSSSTTRTSKAVAHEHAESSFISQTTSSLDSSGLDDSLLSSKSNTQNNSRWIHGKDTPPSSPAPSFGPRTRPSPLSDHRLSKLSASAALHYSSASPFSRPDEFGVLQGRNSAASLDWSSTWPRVSMGHTDSSHSRSSQGVSTEVSPVLDSRRNRLVPSPSSRSFQDRRIRRHSRGFSSGNSLEAIDDSRSRFTKMSNESLQSDIGPSRSRMTTDSIESRRMKRMSASFVSEQEARRSHQEKQSQYDQVSDALDTLRRFLRQRDDGSLSSLESPSSGQSSRPASYAGGVGQRGVPSLGEQVSSMLAESSNTRYAASSRRQRTLRHPPTGPLPPRGSIYTSPLMSSSGVSSPGQEGSRVEAERIAALEDLAKRVRQMKDENQQMLDDL